MTKLFFTIVIMTFFGFVQAQTFKFSAGYGFPWVAQHIGTNASSSHTMTLNPETNSQIHRIKNTQESVRGSYGAGLMVSGSFGYKLSEHIGLDLGLSYIQGKKYTTSSTYTDTRPEILQSSSSESETSQSKTFLFTPTLKFISGPRIFTPYFLFGPVLGKVNFHRELDKSLEENGTKSTEYSYTKFSGGFSLGIRGGVGITLMLNSKLSLFSEIIFTGMNYYPRESEITRYVLNGEDKLNTLPGNVRKTVYQKKVINDSDTANDSPDQPNKNVRFPVAMSSISSSAGVLINLR